MSRRAASQWVDKHLDDQTGKVVVITGANVGLGYEAALQLARKNAQIVIACRNRAKAEYALRSIKQAVPSAYIDLILLDLASLESVNHFADEFRKQFNQLDVLINNAGVMAIPYRETEDGFEMQLGTNHMGHFALTGRLLPLLIKCAPSRVVTVSSGAHHFGRIDLRPHARYHPIKAYGQSKLANLLFAYHLDRKLKQAGHGVSSTAAHPGWAATNLAYAAPEMRGKAYQKYFMKAANSLFAQSAAMGALPTLYAATQSDVVGGDYYGPGTVPELRGYPKRARSSRRSRDVKLAEQLWLQSEKLTGVAYDFGADVLDNTA